MDYRYSRSLDLLEQLNFEHWDKRICQLKYEFSVDGDRPVYTEEVSDTDCVPPSRYGVNKHWGRYRSSAATPVNRSTERPILRRSVASGG
ncbi:hypothetical protein [Synechococcus sp. PCC 7336]|uniref:hypothetical protein n=1 Tax=Synechococcus sp. PCC 7336 TaxID=195250 RepID=UPI00034C4FD8|nr:hypothetical protein [Synechococcus sp. PCC 7336]